MSQQSGYTSNNYQYPFFRHGRSTQASSPMDGQTTSADLGQYTHSSGNTPSVTSGYLDDFGIPNLSNVRTAAGHLDDDHSPFLAGLGRFYTETDGPWNPQKSRARGHHEPLPLTFTVFRDNTAVSECNTLGPCTDSGYGSQARHSVGIPSDYGDVDRGSDVLVNRFADFQLPAGPPNVSSQVLDAAHLSDLWPQGTSRRPNIIPTNDVAKFPCKYCQATFKTQSEHKKHIARHEKPHKCPVPGCRMATEGFALPNDVTRHMNSKHEKGGTRFRCHHGACQEKGKEWPRADNFRTHLRKIHLIHLTADDNLAPYICRRTPIQGSGPAGLSPTTTTDHGSPDLLSNVGVCPGMIFPTGMAEVASTEPTWWQVENAPPSDVGNSDGTTSELCLDLPDVSVPLPTAAHSPRTGAVSANGSSTGHTALRDIRTTLELAERNDNHERCVPGVHRSQVSRCDPHEACYREVEPQEDMSYVRPGDLRTTIVTTFLSPASETNDEAPAIVCDEDDDDDDDDHNETTGNDDDNQDDDRRSPSMSPVVDSDHGDDDKPSGKDDVWPPHPRHAIRHTSRTVAPLENSVKPGTALHLDGTSVRPLENADDDVHRKPAGEHLATLQGKLETLFLKLAKDGQLDEAQQKEIYETLRDVGLAPSTELQGKTEDAEAGKNSSPLHPCPEPECNKKFRRPCELKKHMKRHEKPYGCTQCPNAFGSKNDWKRHENGQHLLHEMWKCDEHVVRPTPGTSGTPGPCGKLCHRRETFRQHVAAQHRIADKQVQDEKLDRCRFGRPGEPRFWCGFCRDVVELDVLVGVDGAKSGAGRGDPFNARYDHIEDHYFGRRGLPKKKASEWDVQEEVAASVAEVVSCGKKTPTPTTGRGVNGKEGRSSSASTAAAVRGGRTSESKKRSRNGETTASAAVARTSPKRVKVSHAPPKDMMWTCCQCHGTWSFANMPGCMTCVSTHERCNNCTVKHVEPTEEQQQHQQQHVDHQRWRN